MVPPAPGPGKKKHQDAVPALFSRDEAVAIRTVEFFAVTIHNQHTRKAYARAVAAFNAWCMAFGISDVRQVQHMHVAAYIEGLQLAATSIKQHLAALRMLFDWLVLGQVLPVNPANSVRPPRLLVEEGKTPVLSPEEVRSLLNAIDTSTTIGLRDRALIGLMVYTFARVGTVLQMRVEDVCVQDGRSWVRLREREGREHAIPCHHNLEAWLRAYIDGLQLKDGKSSLFRTIAGRTGQLSERVMAQADVFRMIGRRAIAAGIRTRIGCHTFRASGITEYLHNGGKLQVAQAMAAHASARTTGLYDRRGYEVSLNELELIAI